MQGIFFDLDGTLVDTEGVAVEVTREWLRSQGHVATDGLERVIVGRTWALAARLLKEQLSLAIAPETLEHELVRGYRERTARGVVSLPGAAEFVRSLSGRYRMLVVSGSPRQDIEHALCALGVTDCFERWLGAEDYARSKPEPDPYLAALSMTGLPPEDVLVLEDSQAGIAAAEAAGLRLVVVTGAQIDAPPNARGKPQIRDFRGLGVDWVRAQFAP